MSIVKIGLRLSEEQMQALLSLAKSGIAQLVETQREALTPTLTHVDTYSRARLAKKFK